MPSNTPQNFNPHEGNNVPENQSLHTFNYDKYLQDSNITKGKSKNYIDNTK
jgi:hypothetical protein